MIKILMYILNVVLAILVLVFCAWLDYVTRTEYKKYIDGTAFYLYLLVFYILYWYVWIYTYKEMLMLYMDKEERREMSRIKNAYKKYHKNEIIDVIRNYSQPQDDRLSLEPYSEYARKKQVIHECRFELYRRELFRRGRTILKTSVIIAVSVILGTLIKL